MAKRKTRRRVARGYYRMTPKRKAALKKAQLVSAKKRSLNKKKVVAGVAAAAIIGGAVARHKLSGSEFSVSLSKMNKSNQRKHASTRPFADVRTHVGIETFGSRFAGSPSPSAPDVTNRVIVANAGVRNVLGLSVEYRHRPLNRRNIAAVRGTRVQQQVPPQARPPRKVDRDSIPMYYNQGYKIDGVPVTSIEELFGKKASESKGGSRYFPSVGKKQARKQNKRLREKGLLP